MSDLLTGLVPGLPDDLRQRILDHAEGVPLYAVETVRMLLDTGKLRAEGDGYALTGDLTDLQVPDSLRALVAARRAAAQGPLPTAKRTPTCPMVAAGNQLFVSQISPIRSCRSG